MKACGMWLREISQHVSSYDSARAFLQDRRILRRQPPPCPETACDRVMTEIKYRDGKTYRCPAVLCRCPYRVISYGQQGGPMSASTTF